MICICIVFIIGLSLASTSGVQLLFPELKQYSFMVKANVSTGILAPRASESYWTLEGRLLILVYDNFTKVRMKFEELQTSVYSKNHGYSYQNEEDANFMKEPWEVEYQENGYISDLYIGEEPVWATNIKRALSVNFQLKRQTGSYSTSEPCLYATCVMVYTARGNTIKKYGTLQLSSSSTAHSWSSVPWSVEYISRAVPDAITTAERVYEIDAMGLSSLMLHGSFQYRQDDHILSVTSELSLYLDSDSPAGIVEKLNLQKTSVQYAASDFTNPTNGIHRLGQGALKNKTFEILLKIARKGIDADNIVRNESVIHSLDFIQLLNTLSQLKYMSLMKIFEDLVLSTSYDLETARNIFLEVLPHARSDACARFIKYLVVEQKEKIEDASILSLIRKLPFNVANYSQSLLEELEVFTKLGPQDFSQEIRHAGVLSFATLVSKTMEMTRVKQDYFDNIVVKYFRMYSDCPQYLDRLIWLQGLCSLGHTSESYIRTIYGDNARNRHERLWASLACGLEARGYELLESALPILTDESEHIQLRVAALHSLLSADIRASDFLFIHNFISSCSSDQLKRFWYSTVKNLERNRFYSGYKSISFYVPFVANQVSDMDSSYWATNNLIQTSVEAVGAAWVQLLSVGESTGPMPAMAALKLSTGGRRPYETALYIIAEGVSSNIYKSIHSLNTKAMNVDALAKLLERMKVWGLTKSQEVHIDIVIKIHDKAVYATHINQSRFESWNGHDFKKSITDFLVFGSHINQQVVYYPVQLDVNIPSELGTPIRLQSSMVEFISVRGNLTAPPDPNQELTWENDLHIRYQGTTLTSLSTTAALLQSEHVARLQQSIVAHLPVKFNISCQLAAQSIAFTWVNPFAQRAGVAYHSRVQIAMDSVNGKEVYSVTSREKNNNENSTDIFFDCDHEARSDIVEKIFTSNTNIYDILEPTLLSNILTYPPRCGVILPPYHIVPTEDEVIYLRLKMADVNVERIDRMEAGVGFLLSYYRLNNPSDVYLQIQANGRVKRSGGNVTVQARVYVTRPRAHPHTHWKLCLEQEHISYAPPDQDVTTSPAVHKGRTTISYHPSDHFQSCSTKGDTKLKMGYKGTPKYENGGLERHVEVHVFGEKLQELTELPFVGELLRSWKKDSINATALVKEEDGLVAIRINNGREIKFKSSLGWLLDSWTDVQLLKKFGFYRECRLQESTVLTLSGAIDQLPNVQCGENLVLADCSAEPAFAITRVHDGSIKMYVGDHNVVAGKGTVDMQDNEWKSVDNFWQVPIGDGVMVFSEETGVLIYKRFNETVVLLPYSYLDRVCGECTGLRVEYCNN